MANPWTTEEVEAAVADYFDMLLKEIHGESYVKTEHNKNLLPKLNNRNRGAVEFKYANISAVLLESDVPYIDGYKPRSNFQGLLKDVVLKQLEAVKPELVAATETLQQSASVIPHIDWHNVLVDPPEILPEKKTRKMPFSASPRKTDFAERESRNRKLGRQGEEFILQYETYRLETAGAKDLAKRIEWVSEKDDGAGFDILSFSNEGKERFIEVKTTNYARSFPFMISSSEVNFSRNHQNQYSLYRLFTYQSNPRFFVLPGDVNAKCFLEPKVYRASFAGAA